ncbi:hypothetical protein CYCD_21100 [Tenuifilaceae bacterium CYCD]|nr:hypothetical protein CYCD_21100 [Tenuifilaceae bacterium CYCD]
MDRYCLFMLVFFTLGENLIFAQNADSCRVLKPEISGYYKGHCKRGLAHGRGVAIGIDRYEGEFVRGKPYGYGIYTWANGDVYEGQWALGVKNGNGKLIKVKSDSIIVGRWYKDKFISLTDRAFSDYYIQLKQNVERVIIVPQIGGVENTIEIVFIRGSSQFHVMDNLILSGSSGSVLSNSTFVGFENVVYPFEGSASYTSINKLGTSPLNCTLKFTIIKQGSWLVKVYF